MRQMNIVDILNDLKMMPKDSLTDKPDNMVLLTLNSELSKVLHLFRLENQDGFRRLFNDYARYLKQEDSSHTIQEAHQIVGDALCFLCDVGDFYSKNKSARHMDRLRSALKNASRSPYVNNGPIRKLYADAVANMPEMDYMEERITRFRQ